MPTTVYAAANNGGIGYVVDPPRTPAFHFCIEKDRNGSHSSDIEQMVERGLAISQQYDPDRLRVVRPGKYRRLAYSCPEQLDIPVTDSTDYIGIIPELAEQLAGGVNGYPLQNAFRETGRSAILYTDGSFKSSVSGYGHILVTPGGDVLDLHCGRVENTQDSNSAETIALMTGIYQARAIGVENLHVRFDCNDMERVLLYGSDCSLLKNAQREQAQHYVKANEALFDQFNNFISKPINRSHNTIANKLAQLGREGRPVITRAGLDPQLGPVAAKQQSLTSPSAISMADD